jgi:glycosyltransferase involved in cell wall biosynthesis
MKLLFFINSLSSGGAERVISKLANHYGDAGHDVTLATLTSIDSDYYSVSPSVARVSINAGQVSTGIASAIANNLKRYIKVRALFRRLEPDTIIAFMPTANVLAVLATFALSKSAMPVIVSERVHPAFDPTSKIRFWFKKFTYRRAQSVVVLSTLSAAWFEHEMNVGSCTVIPNGVALPLPIETAIIAPQDYVSSDSKLLLVVGRISDQKQPFVALAAFQALIAEDPSWQLVFIGSGDLENDLTQTVQQSSYAENVHHIRRAGNISDWYERANLFLSTSKFEGSPNALIEAMAHGCPVIAFDCPTGPAELITHEENGLLLPLGPQSTQAKRVSTALLKLAASDSLRQKIGEQASNVTKTYSDLVFFQRWTELLPQRDPN